jgi:hypothetical protein
MPSGKLNILIGRSDDVEIRDLRRFLDRLALTAASLQ